MVFMLRKNWFDLDIKYIKRRLTYSLQRSIKNLLPYLEAFADTGEIELKVSKKDIVIDEKCIQEYIRMVKAFSKFLNKSYDTLFITMPKRNLEAFIQHNKYIIKILKKVTK